MMILMLMCIFTGCGKIEKIFIKSEFFLYLEKDRHTIMMYDINKEENEVLIEGGFGSIEGNFNIRNNVCYYTSWENGILGLYSVDIETKERVKLKEYDYSEICDINIFGDKLIYRVTSYGKQLEMLDLADNETVYLFEYFKDVREQSNYQ